MSRVASTTGVQYASGAPLGVSTVCATMAKQKSCAAMPRSAVRAGREVPSGFADPRATVFRRCLPVLLIVLKGYLLSVSSVLPVRGGAVTAAAPSAQAPQLQMGPESTRGGAVSGSGRFQVEPTAEGRSVLEAAAAPDNAYTEAARARSLCLSAGAADIEDCTRAMETRVGNDRHKRPKRAKVVGILSQHFRDHLWSAAPAGEVAQSRNSVGNAPDSGDRRNSQRSSLLVASYVKYVEAAGHRVIPIPASASLNHYRKLFLSIDGLLLPGGGAAIHFYEAPYYKAAKLFLDWAVQANDSGRYFPVLGICLGFEAMTIWGSGDNFSLFTNENYGNFDRTRRLHFLPAAQTSKLFGPDRDGTLYLPEASEHHDGSAGAVEPDYASPSISSSLPDQMPPSASRTAAPHWSNERRAPLPQVMERQHNTPRLQEGRAGPAVANLIDKAMLVDLLSNRETAYFHHTRYITRAEFESDAVLSERFALLATVNVPRSCRSEGSGPVDEVVAVVESTRYPFYGVQFHPEKTLFEHNPVARVRHDAYSSWVSQSLAFFFASEVRKSTREPTPFAKEWLHYIERSSPTNLSSPSHPYAYEEVYLFEEGGTGAPVHAIG